MKLSILFFLAHVGLTSGQNHKAFQKAFSNSSPMEPKGKMNEECEASTAKHLRSIGDHAWNETEFSTGDFEEAKGFVQLLKKELKKTKEGEKAAASLDEKELLTQLFPNIHEDPSKQGKNSTDHRLLEVNSAEEIDDFMTKFEGHLATFPYDEVLEKSKELDSIDIYEIYNEEGITMENRESSINVYTLATFFEEKGVISGDHASYAKDYYLSRHEHHRKLSKCSEALIGYVANVMMLMLAVFSVPSKAVAKAASTLTREAMKRVALEAVKGLAQGFVQGLTAGLVANFVDKLVCGTMNAGMMLKAIETALSDWWTWLTFGIELGLTVAAFFLSGGWWLAVKLLSLVVAAASVIKSAIDSANACGNMYRCVEGDGADYRGTIAKTVSGRTCQSWRYQSPHKHGYTSNNWPAWGLVHNYCRAVDHNKPWCYTTDSSKRWEDCAVPKC